MTSLKNEDGTHSLVIEVAYSRRVIVKRYLSEVLEDGTPVYVAKRPKSVKYHNEDNALEASVKRLLGDTQNG